MARISFLLAAITLCCSAFAQESLPGDAYFEGNVLLSDLRYLKEKILETHQDPYTYCTKREFDAVFERAEIFAATGMNFYQFAKLSAECLNVLRDSHSLVDYPSLVNRLADAGAYFPGFTVYTDRTGSGMLIANDEQHILPEGSRLVSVAGMPVQQASARIFSFAVAEGNSQVGSTRIKDALFSPLLPAIVPIQPSTRICLVPNGQQDTVCIDYPCHTRKTWKAIRKEAAKKDKGKRTDTFEFHRHDSLDLTVLRIRSFAQRSSGKYRRFLKSSFKTIHKKNYTNLVIDLRDNTGGNAERAEMIFSYLRPGEVSFPANIIAKQSPTARARIHKRYKGFRKFALNTFFKKNETVQNYLRMARLEDGQLDTLYYKEPYPDGKFPFNGNVQLWVNGRSASASLNVAAFWKQLKMGQIVGEDCLGPETGTWGNSYSVKLPNTGLVVNLSTIRFNADNTFRIVPDALQPDVPVSYTPDDLELDRDPYLLKAAELFRE